MSKEYLTLINLIFDFSSKVKEQNKKIDRSKNRIWSHFEQLGYKVINPIGESFSETRTDVEAHIEGSTTTGLNITEVLKPIIYHEDDSQKLTLIQKGVVIAG